MAYMSKLYDRVEHERKNGVTTGTVYYDRGSSMKFKTGIEPKNNSAFRKEMNEAVKQAKNQKVQRRMEDPVYVNYSKMATECKPGGGEFALESNVEMSEENSQDQEMKPGNKDMSNEENLRDLSSWDIS